MTDKFEAEKLWRDLFLLFGSKNKNEPVWSALAAMSDEAKRLLDEEAEKTIATALRAAYDEGVENSWQAINKWIKKGHLPEPQHSERNGMVLAANQVVALKSSPKEE